MHGKVEKIGVDPMSIRPDTLLWNILLVLAVDRLYLPLRRSLGEQRGQEELTKPKHRYR